MRQFTRGEILDRLRRKVAAREPVIMGGAGGSSVISGAVRELKELPTEADGSPPGRDSAE